MNLKKILAGALAGVMAVASATVVSAATYTKDNPVPDGGITIDGSAGWTFNYDEWIAVTDEKVTVTIENEPFLKEELADDENWLPYNFMIQTNSLENVTAGAILRADAWGWVYDNAFGNLELFDDSPDVDLPGSVKEISWTDWDADYVEGSKGEVKIVATKVNDTTVTFEFLFTTGATEKYTLTYKDGVPEGLAFTIGANFSKHTILSAVYGDEEEEEEEVDTSNWNVAVAAWGLDGSGWKSVSSDSGVLELATTVGAVMNNNGIADAADLGGIAFQVWHITLGDVIDYEFTVTSEDGDEIISKSGTHTFDQYSYDWEKGEYTDEPDNQVMQFSTKAQGWGEEYEFAATDKIVAKVSLPGEDNTGDEEEDEPVDLGDLTVTTYFVEKTDFVELRDGGTLTFTFHNQSTGTANPDEGFEGLPANYENFVMAVVGKNKTAYNGFADEVLIFRADNFAFGGGLSDFANPWTATKGTIAPTYDTDIVWADWPAASKAGFDVTVTLSRDGDTLTYKAQMGDYYDNITATSKIGLPNTSLYVFLTGENVVLSNIQVLVDNPPADDGDDNSGSTGGSTSSGTTTTPSTSTDDKKDDDKKEDTTPAASYTDEDNGVKVTAPAGVVPAGAELKVVPAKVEAGATQASFDITLVVDGKNVQPNGKVEVTITIPKELAGKDTYYVYYKDDNGKLTDMKATFNKEAGTVTFTTDHFSTYIISTVNLLGEPNPSTGAVIVLIPAAIAAAGVLISKKRK